MDSAESKQNLDHFRDLVLTDSRLHDELRATNDLEAFVARAVELGRERGCNFTAETVRSALQEARRALLERWI